MIETVKRMKNSWDVLNSNKVWSFTREIVEMVITVIVLVIIIKNGIGETRWIPSASMRPNLMEGDRLIIEKSFRICINPQKRRYSCFLSSYRNSG